MIFFVTWLHFEVIRTFCHFSSVFLFNFFKTKIKVGGETDDELIKNRVRIIFFCSRKGFDFEVTLGGSHNILNRLSQQTIGTSIFKQTPTTAKSRKKLARGVLRSIASNVLILVACRKLSKSWNRPVFSQALSLCG